LVDAVGGDLDQDRTDHHQGQEQDADQERARAHRRAELGLSDQRDLGETHRTWSFAGSAAAIRTKMSCSEGRVTSKYSTVVRAASVWSSTCGSPRQRTSWRLPRSVISSAPGKPSRADAPAAVRTRTVSVP